MKSPSSSTPVDDGKQSDAPVCRDDHIPLQQLAHTPSVDLWEPGDDAAEIESGQAARKMLQRERFRPLLHASCDRRRFLKIMTASMGAAGLTTGLSGCIRDPEEEIIPYVNQPEGMVLGLPRYYSSVFTRNGYGYGVIATSHQGRPTKIEGNPLHPASLGASDVFMQAALLTLYDPDRSRVILQNGRRRSLEELQSALQDKREQWRNDGGAGLRILTPLLTSPSLTAQLQALRNRYPAARWHQWQAINDDNALRGARLSFGRDVAVHYHLQQADVVLQLDGDLLSESPASLRCARDFARRRDPLQAMSRIYVIESVPGLMGAMADHRLAVRAPLVEQMACYLQAQIALQTGSTDGLPDTPCWPDLNESQRRWLETCGADLVASRDRSLVVAGAGQAPLVHAIAHWINQHLDSVGTTLSYIEPVPAQSELLGESLQALSLDIAAGNVAGLLLLDSNPVFDAPADLNFAELLQRVPFSLHLGEYVDETARHCHWHVPQRHALESWGDARAFDGSSALQQPLIAPLHDAHSPHSLLAFIQDEEWRSDHDCVRDYWQTQIPSAKFADAWRRMLIDGVIEASAAPPATPRLRDTLLDDLPAPGSAVGPVLQFAADPRLWDGRYANNAWLQEAPQPLSKLVWGNALLLGSQLAQELQLQSGDVLEVRNATGTLQAPVLIMPGHPDHALTITLGHDRFIDVQRSGAAVSDSIGVNAYPLRSSANLGFAGDLTLRRTGERVELARTQQHDDMEGRHPVRQADLTDLQRNPDLIRLAADGRDPEVSLYPEPSPEPFGSGKYQWGMSIDLNACIGCGACTLACQAENNIPVVGRDQALAGRVMHWLRIDRYYQSRPEQHEPDPQQPQEDVRTLFQPMLCQHCENAPCEYVCPVGATLHDSEGLNVMIYNRCIGTRNCSQNCPYKVRRFNFLEYNYRSPQAQTLAPLRNPDVSVRSRGVMEKCTWCLQRISQSRRQAKKEMRDIRDGEVMTACQQACPTQAIVFGDISAGSSEVSQARHHPLSYKVLAELNTRPRTTYHARIRNPNPAADKAMATTDKSTEKT